MFDLIPFSSLLSSFRRLVFHSQGRSDHNSAIFFLFRLIIFPSTSFFSILSLFSRISSRKILFSLNFSTIFGTVDLQKRNTSKIEDSPFWFIRRNINRLMETLVLNGPIIHCERSLSIPLI